MEIRGRSQSLELRIMGGLSGLSGRGRGDRVRNPLDATASDASGGDPSCSGKHARAAGYPVRQKVFP